MSAPLPAGEPVRPNRNRPLRTSSGPPSPVVPLPACLAGVLRDDGEPPEAS